jgi:hypothetical protein
MKIRTEDKMAYVHIDESEIEMIKKHIIDTGTLTVRSVTLNCVMDDVKTPLRDLQYPLREPLVIMKEEEEEKDKDKKKQ